MKLFTEIKKNLKNLTSDRLMLLVVVAVFVAGVVFSWSILSKVQVYDQLIYTRFTVFGRERLHRDSWTSRVVITFLGVFISLIHPIIIAKIYKTSGRRMAIFASIFSVIVVILGLNIVNLSIGGISN